jgi:hypothetical protein
VAGWERYDLIAIDEVVQEFALMTHLTAKRSGSLAASASENAESAISPPCTASQSLESPRKPRADHNQVEVHKKARTAETKLLIHAATVLA